MITPGAVSNAEIKVAVSLISFLCCPDRVAVK